MIAKQNSLLLHQTLAQVKEFAKVKSEHDLRLKVKDVFFGEYDVDVEDERIDFLVYHEKSNFFTETFLWAESKDKPTDVLEMFAQLLLTIKKKVDAGEMPPKYLGMFDREKIAFTEYYNALDIFHLNDFDWTERPSSVSKKTINQVAKYLKNIIVFNFTKDTQELVNFIRENFALGKTGTAKAQINKNNFVTVFMKWLESVRSSIDISADEINDYDLIDGDFYLADLLSEDNITLADFKKLKVILQRDCYEINIPGKRRRVFTEVAFLDQGQAHELFWERYQRPPMEEFWDYMKDRRDLLVPQDIRERKGSFFTPQIWVEKSQEYLAKVFGENWQDEYYIWDCCCGTGNLLAGLVNPYNVWASTIDQADVDILHASINNDKCNLLASHVFRFDFLNGNFDELPKELQDIINDPEKQKKLIVYINPPYAEATSHKRRTKSGVAKDIEASFKSIIGAASNEIYAYFFAKIYQQIPEGKLASFSTVKYVNAPNFAQFREFFKASFGKGFLVPANTFDNVHGQFPIGFLIWDFEKKRKITEILCDLFNASAENIGRKRVYGNLPPSINKWIAQFSSNIEQGIGYLNCVTPMFQNQGYVWLDLVEQRTHCLHLPIHSHNLVVGAIYFAVRHCIKADWINNRDQFLCPKDDYKKDKRFQNDCLIFTLFHHQNRIKNRDGINHWIPFTAREVSAKDNFKSTFMSDFLQKRKLSKEAKAVFEAGKALWTYYHETIRRLRTPSVNASLYEIREHFKGRDAKGKMKTKATDERFNELDAALRLALKKLAEKIQPKVYEYGFLKK